MSSQSPQNQSPKARSTKARSQKARSQKARSPEAEPLKALVVADQRHTLRYLSRFLAALGYEVEQVANGERALAAINHGAPDFLIFDCGSDFDAALRWCRLVSSPDRANYVYTLLMVANPRPEDLKDALEAGVDDFLAKPIAYGELLGRLRVGARVLEFERRLREQSGVDFLTGLLNEEAFRERLRKACFLADQHPSPTACVLMDIDFLGHINRARGHEAGNAVLRQIAETLGPLCAAPRTLACFGKGRFGAILPDMSDIDAAAWAEDVRRVIAEPDDNANDNTPTLTLSAGIADLTGEVQSADDLLDRAEQALQTAKVSGRNCVVRFGEFDDSEAWADFAAPGKLFERTLARDVMTPCTLVLDEEDSVAQAAALLQQAKLDTLPVVDTNGKLLGVVSEEAILRHPAGEQRALQKVRDIMTTDLPVYEEEASFAELRDFFTTDTRPLVAVVCNEKPVGLVTPNNLAVLSMPLTTDTFAPETPFSKTTDYLLVSDLCPLSDNG